MAEARRIVIAGGSGFIGRCLARWFAGRGDEVVILTRHPQQGDGPRQVHWDGRTLGDWAREIEGADTVINLAGKNVNCRYTRKALHEIDQSRVDAVTVMAEATNKAERRPRVLIQASTTAIYGHTADDWCDESQPPGHDTPGSAIPVRTASQWEDAFNAHPTPGVRRVLMRISFVLGKDGGALQTLARLTRCFLGGAAGNGKQYISWIHMEDCCRIVADAIDHDDMEGTYNLATPFPERNKDFMRELRRALHRPWSPPTPAIMVRLGCFLMRTEPVLALTGRRVTPKRLLERGFEFRYAKLPEALRAVYGGKN